jgi:hypothetical protein
MASKGLSGKSPAINLVAEVKRKAIALAKARAAVAKLEAEIDQIRDALAGVPPGSPVRLMRRETTPARPAPYIITSSVGLTADLLRETGKPMHVNDIISRLAERGHRVNPATLVGNLSRHIKAGKTFDRHGPGVYGLREWREVKA